MPPGRSAGPGAEAELPEYAGHYRLEGHLGSGGMGVVHLARSASGMQLAVKVVHAEFARDPEFRGRFRQEIAAARRVSGAFTAPVVDADPDAERPWMATLFIPGLTLAEHVKRNGPLRPAQLRQVMAGLAEALRDIHRAGVVHRDLKPSNVLLAEDSPKVIDFGISRPKDSELRTETGKLIGTPPFMAPEQFRRPREVGPAADVFALGSVLVHAATGRGPFDSDSPYLVAYQVVHDEPDLTDVPDDLGPLIMRCLAKEPEDRPTPDELMKELRRVSALYDTQAFIPSQRGAAGVGPGAGAGAGTGAGTGARAGSGAAAGDRWPSHGAPAAPHSHSSRAAAETHIRSSRAPAEGPAESRSADSPPADSPSDSGHFPDRPGPNAPGRPPSHSTEAGDSRAAGVTRRRRAPIVGGALTVVLAVAAASVALTSLSDDGDGPSSARSNSTAGHAAHGFRPWVRELGSGPGASAAGMPTCSYGGGALRCALPGVLAASVDPRDGDVLWSRRSTGASGDPDASPTATAPVFSGGLVHTISDDGLRLRALDPRTGKPRWDMDIAAYDGRVLHAGGTVLLTAADGTVTGVDGATGGKVWSHRLPGQTQPTFAYFGKGLAYATTVSPDGSSTQVSAVDPESGAVRWKRRLSGNLAPVGTSKGAVCFTERNTASETVALVRYIPTSGSVHRSALPTALPQATATLHGDSVYLLAVGGALVAVDTATGTQRWRLETSISRGSAPAADDRHVYLTAPDGRLLATDIRTGKPLGQTRPRLGNEPGRVVGELPAPVVGEGGRVYGSAPDGSVFAVDGREPERW
ncbi:serine/threonine-protein kinase [Streptomyces sp. NPDC058266]|uniref:serine/threonine-protein kinase n=1 Tax=Streptomyces sp. NPDC058266 TaxID=3346412 RepID=UPI0036E12C6E